MGCRAAEQKIVALVAGELAPADRVALEAHGARCARCGDALRDAVSTSLAIERAFAPLRARTAALSPARVRLATRAPEPEPRPSWTGIFGRLSEATMALGFAALMLGGSLDVVRPGSIATPPSILQQYFRTQPPYDEQGYARWMRLQLRTVQPDAPAVRYPVGGTYDVDEPVPYGDGKRVGQPPS
jgi:hypothetical protein